MHRHLKIGYGSSEIVSAPIPFWRNDSVRRVKKKKRKKNTRHGKHKNNNNNGISNSKNLFVSQLAICLLCRCDVVLVLVCTCVCINVWHYWKDIDFEMIIHVQAQFHTECKRSTITADGMTIIYTQRKRWKKIESNNKIPIQSHCEITTSFIELNSRQNVITNIWHLHKCRSFYIDLSV